MAEVSLEQQFHGTMMLMVLHLRRLAKSNDVDAGFEAARELKMIDAQQERFMRENLALDKRLQDGDADLREQLTPELVKRLQASILSINSADPA